jgi:hypothetical protein
MSASSQTQKWTEVFMAPKGDFLILKKCREIVSGPGAKQFALGMISDEPHPVQLSVRGLINDCNCSVHDHCHRCKNSTAVWLLIAGTLNPDDTVSFWVLEKMFSSLNSAKIRLFN